MGAWGVGITQDDTVLDLIDDFKNILKETKDIETTTKLLIEKNKFLIDDEDEGPLFWIALAKCQWEYGNLHINVLEKVIDDFKKENGLSIWKEESEKDYLGRKKVINKFIDSIKQINHKPKKFPKLIIRKAPFEAGDCLSIKVNENYYGAALVVKVENPNPEYGQNLIIPTTYWDMTPPKQEDFIKTEWLKLTYGNWKGIVHDSWYSPLGFRKFKDIITKVGNIDVSQFSEITSNSYSSWNFLIDLIGKQMEFCKSNS